MAERAYHDIWIRQEKAKDSREVELDVRLRLLHHLSNGEPPRLSWKLTESAITARAVARSMSGQFQHIDRAAAI